MPKENKHYPNTTEYRDHGAKDHDHQTEWTKNDRGRIESSDKHVPKGTGGYASQKVGDAKENTEEKDTSKDTNDKDNKPKP